MNSAAANSTVLNSGRTFRVVGLGEVLWDLLPTGRQLGGAPANFVYHAQALGAEGCLVSRVGADALGREALDRLRTLEIDISAVQLDSAAPTGTVSVLLGLDGQPSYTIHDRVAWDYIEATAQAESAVINADALCFGSLAQRHELSRSSIYKLIGLARLGALKIFDVNLRQDFYSRTVIDSSLRAANVLKINDAELPVLAGLFDISGDNWAVIQELARRYGLVAVALTRGAAGSLLFGNGQWSDQPGIPVIIKDTIGAGDSFTAAMALGLLAGWKLDEVNRRAGEVAAYVCSCSGAMPSLPEPLRALFQSIRPIIRTEAIKP